MGKIDPRTRFVLYAVALFVATHWPALVLPSVVPVSDKPIHFLAWGLWLALLASAWKMPLALLLAIGVVCGAADEASQAIPVLNRHSSLADALANVIGVVAVWSMVVVGRQQAPSPNRRWKQTSCLQWFWVLLSAACIVLAWTNIAADHKMVPTLLLGGLVFMVSALRIRRTPA